MSKYIVEFQALSDPVVGVPILEKTSSDWKAVSPAIFATESEAQAHMDALSLHYASVLGSPHSSVLRYFRVVPLQDSKAVNVGLIAENER